MKTNKLLEKQKHIYINHLIKILKQQIYYNNLINQYNHLYSKQKANCVLTPTDGFARCTIGTMAQPIKIREAINLGYKLGLLSNHIYHMGKNIVKNELYYTNEKSSQYQRELKDLVKKLHKQYINQ